MHGQQNVKSGFNVTVRLTIIIPKAEKKAALKQIDEVRCTTGQGYLRLAKFI